jgi:hypothetical protein
MSDPRLPTEHGKHVSEVVDLGGPVARITRHTYVGHQWTQLAILVPADVDQPAQSVEVQLSQELLERLVGRLAWPV